MRGGAAMAIVGITATMIPTPRAMKPIMMRRGMVDAPLRMAGEPPTMERERGETMIRSVEMTMST